ncbi:phage tail protein [Okeania sp.]|uniref:phage tail protein n=1 Tax=Okeania sp. TaxID=3100323 RepID=UPI002B4AC883|nr:phage tail protein [Okeania sp.]MEB3340090.1 phage tail protein [Okeania sp.]
MNKKRIFGEIVAILLSVTLIFVTQVNSASADEVPIGTIMAYGGLVDGSASSKLEQQGWLVCDGTGYNREDYPDLYQIMGDSFGEGDGVKTFNVPDFRGRFLRGVDHGTGNDPDAQNRSEATQGGAKGDHVGSYQNDQANSIDTFTTTDTDSDSGYSVGTETVPDDGTESKEVGIAGYKGAWITLKMKKKNADTRPKNIYVNWIIKAVNL